MLLLAIYMRLGILGNCLCLCIIVITTLVLCKTSVLKYGVSTLYSWSSTLLWLYSC